MAAQAFLYGGLAALQITGGYFASQNIKDTAKLNREIDEMNAQFAELDAYDALTEGYSKAARYQSIVDQTLADQQTIMAAQDIDVNYGSAASIQQETRFTAELNKMEIEKQAQQQALGYKRQARDYRIKGSLEFAGAKSKASSAMFESVAGAANTSLTGYERSK